MEKIQWKWKAKEREIEPEADVKQSVEVLPPIDKGRAGRKWWRRGGESDEKRKKKKAAAKLTGRERLLFYSVGAVLIILLAWLFFESLWLGALMSPLLVFLENTVAEEMEQRKKHKWEEAFSKFLEELDSHIRLGHSLELSTTEAIKASEVFADERWMIRELEMNVYVAEVFQRLAEKKEVESLYHFTGVLTSSLHSGGNLHELMQNSMVQIQKRIKMEEDIQSMMTKVKYESRILTLFVPFLLLYLKGLSPNFKQIMYHSFQGRLTMTVCLGIYLLASYLCYQMTQAEM